MHTYLSKFLYILAAKKSSILLLLSSFVLVSLLDALGIGLIGPFTALATNPKLIFQNPWSNWVYTQLNFQSSNQFIALVGLVVIITFYIKSFLFFHVQKYINEVSFIQMARLRLRLMSGYLSVKYSFHLSKNSALMIQNIINETHHFGYVISLGILTCVANGIIVFVIVLVLIRTSLLATVSILGIMLLAFALYYQFKDKMAYWGKEASESIGDSIRIINHGLGGLKETKVIGCEPYFENQLSEQVHRFATAASLAHAFQNLPRISLESLLITFVVGFMSISQILNQNPQNIIPVISIFAVASIRLMPSASQLISTFGMLRNSEYTLNKLYYDLKELELEPQEKKKGLEISQGLSLSRLLNFQPHKSQAMAFIDKITLDRVTYRYSNNSNVVLKDICLTLRKGQSIAFIGKSGAGKTTLVDILLGLLTPEGGDIRVDGISIYNDLRLWQNLIGYIPQSIFLIDDTIERNIAFGVPDNLIDSQKLKKAIQAAQLVELVEQLSDGVKTSVGERGVRLSGGQRQRIGIARALYHEREILVLDEATSALDTETENLVSEALKSLSSTKTMIIIAHRLTTVEHCDCIYLLDKGEIVKSGSYQEVVLEETTLT
jgi:ABC-type multidrug transport system fused ATPase/permease subunit